MPPFFLIPFDKFCLKKACYLITAIYIKQKLNLLLEIASSVLKVAWDDMIAESKELIRNNCDGKNAKTYRGDWNRKIKAAIKSMGYSLSCFNKSVFVSKDNNQEQNP